MFVALMLAPALFGGIFTDARYFLYDGNDPEFSGVYSIGEPFLPPSVRIQPLHAAKDAIVVALDTIADGAFNDQVGAVAASSIVNWTEPLSSDFNHVRAKLRGAPLGTAGALSTGVEAARLELLSNNARPAARKMMVMVTDGKSDPTDVLNQIQMARDAGITVHVIGVGANLDAALLLQMAATGGGTSVLIDAGVPAWVYTPELQSALARVASNQIAFSLIR